MWTFPLEECEMEGCHSHGNVHQSPCQCAPVHEGAYVSLYINECECVSVHELVLSVHVCECKSVIQYMCVTECV